MLSSDEDVDPSIHQRRRGAPTKIAKVTSPAIVALDKQREQGLAVWKHYHKSDPEKPINWYWAAKLPAFGKLALQTVYDLSDGGVIDSRSTALSYQTWTKPFFLHMDEEWNPSAPEASGVTDCSIPVEAYLDFKNRVDERVEAEEIKSKTGYGYKGAITRILKEIWDKDPDALGPGWTERTFIHDDFEDDYKQREPYSAAEVRRLLDIVVKLLEEAAADGSALDRDAWLVEIATYTAVALRLGIETECLDQLRLDGIKTNPEAQTITFSYTKKRAPNKPHRAGRVQNSDEPNGQASETETREEKTGSFKTAGGVLALMLRRAALFGATPEATLWPKRFGAHRFAEFTKTLFERGLRDDDGRELKIVRTKFRVTYKTAKNVRHGGMLSLMPEDNTRDVNAKHYLESDRMRPLYERAVVDAAEQALAYALEKPKVLTLADDASDAEIANAASELQVPPAEVAAALKGETDVWISSCRDFYNSPFDKAGSPCSKSFYGCLGCRNALITRRSLPRLLSFYSHIVTQRSLLPDADWQNKFGTAHDQIINEVLPRFPESMLNEARIIAEGLNANIHLPPEMLS